MNRQLLIATALLAAVALIGTAGLTGYTVGKKAERGEAATAQRRAIDRVRLEAERKVSKAEKLKDKLVADAMELANEDRASDVAWVNHYADCLADKMFSDGTFFDSEGLTEQGAINACDQEHPRPVASVYDV